jgi:hypothetical protein
MQIKAYLCQASSLCSAWVRREPLWRFQQPAQAPAAYTLPIEHEFASPLLDESTRGHHLFADVFAESSDDKKPWFLPMSELPSLRVWREI